MLPLRLAFSAVALSGVAAPVAAQTHVIAESKLVAEDTIRNPGGFGYSLAELPNGDLVAGSYRHSRTFNGGYVFSRRDHGAMAHQQTGRLANENAGWFSSFGFVVGASGDQAAVGAPTQDVRVPGRTAPEGGMVHVYEREGAGWKQVAQIYASDFKYGDQFGSSISMDGDQMVVGSFTAIYVFERNEAGTWQEKKRIVPTTDRSTRGFGMSVSISGDVIAAGAGQYDSSNQPSGSVFLFEKNAGGAGNWGQTRVLVAPDGPADNRFGAKVDLDGDRLAVSALRADSALNPGGAVHLFEKDQGGHGNWGAVAKVTSGTGSYDWFGSALDLRGDQLLVGAALTRRAYLFDRTGAGANGWGNRQTLAPSDEGRDPQAGSRFGHAVLLGADTLFVGAYQDPSAGINNGGGAIYTFRHTRGLPVLGRVPENTTRTTGESATFSVTAGGPAALSYQWRFNGEDLAGQTAATLNLTGLRVDESGFYTVEVRNSHGAVVSPPAYLEVKDLTGSPALTIPRAGSGAITGEGYTQGFSFTPSQRVQLTDLGCIDIEPDGFTFPVEIGLWRQSTGELLAHAVLHPDGTSHLLRGAHRYVPVAPVTLVEGTRYVIGVFSTYAVEVKSGTSGLQVDPLFQVHAAMNSRDVVIKMPQDTTSSSTGRSMPNFLYSATGVAKLEVANGRGTEAPLLNGSGGEVVALPDAAIGTPGATQTLQVRNPGDAPLKLSAPLLPPGVELAGPLPAEIPAGGSASLGLRLRGTTVGVVRGEVFLASNVAHLNPFTFSVEGEVVMPVVAIDALSPAAVAEDGVSSLRFRVSRTGPVDAPLHVALATSGSAAAGEYTLTGATTSEVILPAGSSTAEWTVLPTDDRMEETDEAVLFEIQESESYVRAAGDTQARGIIRNDDHAPVTVVGPLREVVENGRLEVPQAAGVLAGATDQDDGPEALTAELVESASHGTLTLQPDGSFVYQPSTGYHGPDGFTFRASDGFNRSAVTAVNIVVVQQVDLRLEVTESADPILAGTEEAVWHRYTLSNAGPSTATGIAIAVTRDLPEGATPGVVNASQGELVGNVWQLESLPPGESAQLLLPFIVPAGVSGSADGLASSASVQAIHEPLILTGDDQAAASTTILSPASMSLLGLEVSPLLNRQTGLLTHKVTVLNENPAAVGSFQLVILGLPAGVIPQGATGTTADGNPYFLLAASPLDAGGRLELTIEYSSANRAPVHPTYRIDLLRDSPPSVPLEGERFAIDHFAVLADGSFLIEWSTVPEARYVVEYSADCATWIQAGEPLGTTANRMQWIDDGPPKTATKPGSEKTRYYRVVVLPEGAR